MALMAFPRYLTMLDRISAPGLDTYKNVLEMQPKQKAVIMSGFTEIPTVLLVRRSQDGKKCSGSFRQSKKKGE